MISTPLRLGLVLTGAYDRSTDPRIATRQRLDLVLAAEAAGFDSVWMGEHYLGAEAPWLQNISFMSYLAGVTERVDLGLFVIAPLHGLFELAEQLATLDIVSGGRAAACFVRGWRKKEFAAFGIPYASAGKGLEEDVDLILRLWRGDEVSASGVNQFDRVQIGPRPLRSPEEMLFMGGSSEHAAKQAGRLGRPFIHSSHLSIDEAEALTAQYRAAGGRAPYAIVRQLYVADSSAAAIADAAPTVGAYYKVYAEWGLGSAPAVTQEFETAAQTRFVIGDPSACIGQLKRYVARLNVSAVLCRIGWPGLSHEKTLRAIELAGSEIMPALRT